MRPSLLVRSLFALAAPLFALHAAEAQDAAPAAPAPEAPAAAPEAPAPEDPNEAAAPAEPTVAPEDAAAEGPAPVLEPPALSPLELDPATAAAGQNGGAKAPPAPPPVEKKGWTLPETVFHMHGYLRMRGTLLKDGSLGHSGAYDRLAPGGNYDPFTFFRSEDSTATYTRAPGEDNADSVDPVQGGCGGSANGGTGRCDKKTQVGGDLRLRLKPEIHLSDDVRIKAWVDVLDNVGLGTLGYGPNNFYQPDDANDLGNAIRVRRAWGEARNRGIGELRFGRMGADWGLGILDNGGDRNGIDSDFSSDVDRIMGITNLAGFYFMAAYDWASQGKVTPGSATPSGLPIDRAQRDDLSALTLSAAHRLDAEVQRSKLQRGEAVLNYGLYFIYRRQQLKNRSQFNAEGNQQPQFYRIDQKQFAPDLWLQFLWEGLRVELEAAFVAGQMEGACPRLLRSGDLDPATYQEITYGNEQHINSGHCKMRQLGVALETEYRLIDDRLGIHFLSGLASGDSHSYGLAQTNDPSYQVVTDGGAAGDRTLSTYQFHPDYRVDLILWRTVMRRVAGAYYFKPGISYDFIHDPYGQRAGARLDVIYSRATSPKQTYGQSGNLGLELNVSLYYRSEDGPDPMDGFYSTLQWGILFPFQGLEYADRVANAPSSKNAMILRGVAGIAF